MSLIKSQALRILYDAANAPGAQEHETMTFWQHLLAKHYFYEEHYVVAQEKPPSNNPADRLRRVDLIVSIVKQGALKIIVLCEGKRAGGSRASTEAQSTEAALAHCRAGGAAWVLNVVGTTCAIWQITSNPIKEIVSRTGYIDADSDAASQLNELLLFMRRNAPQGTLIVPSQPNAPQPPLVTSSSSTTEWSWSEEHNRYYKYKDGQCVWEPLSK